VCRCGRGGELKSSRPVFGHLPTLNVGKMWVYPTWVGDPHFTHISYPRPTCRRSLLTIDTTEPENMRTIVVDLIFFTPVFFANIFIARTRCPRPTDTEYVNGRLRTCD